MKKLSEQFLEMSQQTAAVENKVATIREGNRKEFEAHVAEAQAALRSAQAAFTARLDKVEASVATKWRELKNSFDVHVANTRQKVAERKLAIEQASAEARAEDAEVEAEIAAEFARLTAAAAEAAMLEAKQARSIAKSMEQSRS